MGKTAKGRHIKSGKYVRSSPRIGIHEWNLNVFDEMFDRFFKEAFKEALDIATEEYDAVAYFPFSATPPEEAGTILVELPLGPEEYDNPRWSFQLDDLVDDLESIMDEVPDDEDKATLVGLRDKFRELADKLNEWINRKPPKSG